MAASTDTLNPIMDRTALTVLDLGLIEFHAAHILQERLVAGIASGHEPETLLLLHHPPVYTTGAGGNPANLLDPAVPLVRTNRGGDVTFHGPGQLIGYPLLRLTRFGCDLHRYLRFLEEVLIETVALFGVAAGRIDHRTGVWTNRGKLASIGIGVRHLVSMHGFALNCGDEPDGFAVINPCGITGCPMTSLHQETGFAVDLVSLNVALATTIDELLPGIPGSHMNVIS